MREFHQFGHFRNGNGLQHFSGQQQLGPRGIGLGQAVETGNFMAQPEQGAVQVEHRRFPLGLDQRQRVHRPAFLGLAQGFERKARVKDLLVGAGIEFVGHDGALQDKKATGGSDSFRDRPGLSQAQKTKAA